MIATASAGSYPRIGDQPEEQELRRVLNRLDRGEATLDEVKATQDEAVRQAIAEQVEAGLDIITDGLIRWDDPVTHLARGLSGFEVRGLVRYLDTNTFYREPVVVEKVEWTGPVTVVEFRFAQEQSPQPVKAVLPGPYSLARIAKDQHYASFPELVQEVAGAVRSEALALQDAGAEWIQFDEPMILRHPADAEIFAEAILSAVEGISGSRVLVHTFFGSADGLYDALVGLPVAGLGVDLTYYGEATYRRITEGGFPEEKILAAGLIDARNTRLEAAEDVLGRLRELTRVVSPDRILLVPNTGLEYLPRDYARKKLANMVQIARQFG